MVFGPTLLYFSLLNKSFLLFYLKILFIEFKIFNFTLKVCTYSYYFFLKCSSTGLESMKFNFFSYVYFFILKYC